MTQARREAPGGAGGVANDDPAPGVQRGGASSGPAEGPRRVREGGAHPERRAAAQGSRGATPGERQLERRPEGPECQLISEYVPTHLRRRVLTAPAGDCLARVHGPIIDTMALDGDI